MSNTIDLFTGKSVEELEALKEANDKEAIEENLKLFDEKVAIYRDQMAKGELDSFVMMGLVGGCLPDRPYTFLGEFGDFAKLAVLLSDVQVQMESYALAFMSPEMYEEYD